MFVFVVIAVMALFDLVLEDPSMDRINACQKADLYNIAKHLAVQRDLSKGQT